MANDNPSPARTDTPTEAIPSTEVPADLEVAPVWNLDDVATVLRRPPRAVRELVGTPGFPRPRRHHHQLWWLPADILEWVGAPARPSQRRRSRRG